MEELKKKNQKYILLQVSDTAATARILEQQMAPAGRGILHSGYNQRQNF